MPVTRAPLGVRFYRYIDNEVTSLNFADGDIVTLAEAALSQQVYKNRVRDPEKIQQRVDALSNEVPSVILAFNWYQARLKKSGNGPGKALIKMEDAEGKTVGITTADTVRQAAVDSYLSALGRRAALGKEALDTTKDAIKLLAAGDELLRLKGKK